ncbi:MAG: hypothetical protein ABSA47_04875 [Verrucomicrobiota bacterium]|jgi:hypothetical protein
MPAKAIPKASTPVLATKHKDKRANFPTEELRDFVADEEKAPKKILYPRDPSLDPELGWKGKKSPAPLPDGSRRGDGTGRNMQRRIFLFGDEQGKSYLESIVKG